MSAVLGQLALERSEGKGSSEGGGPAPGSVLWTASVENGDHRSPAVTTDGVCMSYACEVSYRFDPATGQKSWTHTTGCEGSGGRTAVVHGDRVYVRDDAGMGPVILALFPYSLRR